MNARGRGANEGNRRLGGRAREEMSFYSGRCEEEGRWRPELFARAPVFCRPFGRTARRRRSAQSRPSLHWPLARRRLCVSGTRLPSCTTRSARGVCPPCATAAVGQWSVELFVVVDVVVASVSRIARGYFSVVRSSSARPFWSRRIRVILFFFHADIYDAHYSYLIDTRRFVSSL